MDFENLFQGSFNNWGLEEWLIIGVSALILIILLALLLKPKKKKAVAYKEVQVESKTTSPAPVKSEPEKEVVVEKEVANELPKEETQPVSKPTPKAAPKTTAKSEVKTDEPDDKVVKYHVSQNKDAKSEFKNQWRVRKQGSSKTIKYFKTQAEAIKYAESLAENNDTSIVIHKRDGTIRKQDYSKKKSS